VSATAKVPGAAGRGGRLAGSASAAASVLARSRLGADRASSALRERRDEADPSHPTARASLPRDVAPPSPVDGVQRLFPPASLERVALALARDPARPTVNVQLADGSGLRLTRGAAGIEVVLEVRPEARRAAEAELPAIDAALRARGVKVAAASVRATARSPGGSAGERALTGPRPSDTTASPSGGTVAKW
ncbi:MAG: hypothetical protein ACJ79E_06255, partial [Anaeromyxobacteraceae bacterium]